MADLLTKSYTMSNLRTKYHNFIVPDFRIKIDGTQVTRSSLAPNLMIDNVKIKLSMDAAGSLGFNVLNAYDLKDRSFKSAVRKQICVGKTITAEIGYAGALTQVFSGYIHKVAYEYSDSPVILVTALDVIRLMQENEVLQTTYEGKSATEIFTGIMKKYSQLCSAGNVKTDASDRLDGKIIQKGSDYRFIKEVLCPKACKDFYVLNGTAYFVDAEKKKSSVLTLEWGKDILSFSCDQSYLHKRIKVTVVNKKDSENALSYTRDVKGVNQKTVLSAPLVKNINIKTQMTRQEAELQVEKAVRDELKEHIRCTGSCIGIPHIVPGRSLTIKKLDDDVDGVYEIMAVEHSIGADGFTTQFELGGKG